jgi:nickel-dependent lactate racemase
VVGHSSAVGLETSAAIGKAAACLRCTVIVRHHQPTQKVTSVSELRTAVDLSYGDHGLPVSLPTSRTVVVEPRFEPGVADVPVALRDALRHPVAGPPLRERVGGRRTVAISICDLTRPQPRREMVQAVLDELEGLVSPSDVTVLVATGTHRGNTDDELRSMLGDDLLSAVRVVNHDARDQDRLSWQGVHGNGVPVWLNREWVDADLKITTGFVEPHFFAGFSGGPKLVAPGLAGMDTVLTLHDAARIGHPNARWGVCVGNPVHDDVRAIAEATGVDFAFDVILNRQKEIVAAFGGDLLAMHERAREHSKGVSMQPVRGRADVVVTTNSGYPLDQNLYQAVKGMSAAMEVVKPGGLIICAAECRDGFPDHGSYRSELTAADSPAQILEAIGQREHTVPDQWQLQVQAKIQAFARVGVHTDGLTDDELRSAHLTPIPDIAEAVERELQAAGDQAWVCVLPEGPQTIPYVADEAS